MKAQKTNSSNKKTYYCLVFMYSYVYVYMCISRPRSGSWLYFQKQVLGVGKKCTFFTPLIVWSKSENNPTELMGPMFRLDPTVDNV